MEWFRPDSGHECEAFARERRNPRCGQYVYHYTPWYTLLGMMRERALRLGCLGGANDPRESGEWLVPVLYGTAAQREGARSLRDAVGEYKSRVRFVSFSQDRSVCEASPVPGTGYDDAGFSRPSMWAHYAGNHTGCCIVFDRKRLVALLDEQFGLQGDAWAAAGPVEYTALESDELFTGIEFKADGRSPGDVVSEHFRAHQRVFFQKHIDWSAETEYRLVVYRGNRKDDAQLQIDDAIVGLVLGAAFPEMCLSLVADFNDAFSLHGCVSGSLWTGPHWEPRALSQVGGRLGFEEPSVGLRAVLLSGTRAAAAATARAGVTFGGA